MDQLKVLQESRKDLGEEIQRWRDKITAPDYRFSAQDQESWDTLNGDYNDVSRKVDALERADTVEAELSAPPLPIGKESSPEDHAIALEKRSERIERVQKGYESPLPKKDFKSENRAIMSWLKTSRGLDIDHEDHLCMKAFGLRAGMVEWEIPMAKDYQAFRSRMMPGHFPEYRDVDTSINTELIASEVARRIEVARLAIGPVRQAGATVLRTPTGSQLNIPTSNETASGISALDEGLAMTDAETITTSTLQLDSFKYTTNVIKVSQEMVEDGVIDIINFALDTVATRVARGENALFTTGTGSGQPNGITIAATSAQTIDLGTSGDPIIDLFHSVDPAYRNTSSRFMAHDSVWASIRKIVDDSGGSGLGNYLWQPGLQAGMPDRLIGVPTIMNQDMDNDGTTTGNEWLLYGDISKFIIRDVASGLRLKVFRELYGASDEIGIAALIRIDSDLLDAGTHPVKVLTAA